MGKRIYSEAVAESPTLEDLDEHRSERHEDVDRVKKQRKEQKSEEKRLKREEKRRRRMAQNLDESLTSSARMSEYGDSRDQSATDATPPVFSEGHKALPEEVHETKSSDKLERKRLKRAKKLAEKEAKLNGAAISETDSIHVENGNTLSQMAIANGTSHSAATKAPKNNSAPSASYDEHEELTALPSSEVDSFLTKRFIAFDDPLIATLRPLMDFKYLPTDASAAQGSVLKGFASPTPIQAATWPYLFSGRDLIGVAETGSGKTLAFGIPCVRHVQSLASAKKTQKQTAIRAVIVSPTRELAQQIHAQMSELTAGTDVRTVCIYGGVSKDEQRSTMKRAQIVIATPGRLNDFIQEGAADLRRVSYLVLDEADRMLDRGFEEEVRKIVSAAVPDLVVAARDTEDQPSKRKKRCQISMFTATWPLSIRSLAATYLHDPVRVTISSASFSAMSDASGLDSELRANASITQRVEVISPQDKEARLLAMLQQHHRGPPTSARGKPLVPADRARILVFCLYKKEAARVAGTLARRVPRGAQTVTALHGDMAQAARSESIALFRSGERPILVATDVAARGLDIPSVALVINYTFPLTVEDYVHRIGRTGRAGNTGEAVTFFTEHDKALSGGLINVLRAAGQEVPDALRKFGGTVKSKRKAEQEGGGFSLRALEEGGAKAKKITFD